ncbi:DUF1272 domain-containing protein [Pseudemcibacter aquimaris]|uniref:DUF1272 domain-containing protein n=1 Tax=Pseudemcibacter aquimaris TaxID=2857064 RepID=UPI002013A587|nr:DUF1272 domain-containing protein [Pseudemcibacter aquimaris]MCC3861188.1 DUF1272 domain-containing protein [Pseudemcibacter aquimaris]WDU57963.1 DUF1272 domain-containing protein [Pseudemcibacter aquimaris]
MLEIRPECECCDKKLPPNSTEAYICSYECTWCEDCTENILKHVCPNCGGGVVKRPIRPANEWRKGLSTKHQPPSTKIVKTKFTHQEISDFADKMNEILPENR